MNKLANTATIILTVYGLIVLPLDIIDRIHSRTPGIILAVAVTLIFTVSTFYHFIPSYLKRFGVKRAKTNQFVIESNIHVAIDENYKATINKEKKMVFIEKPTPDDLIDLIEVSNVDSVDESVYIPINSKVTKFVRKKKNTLAAYWQPIQEIIPFTLYTHKCAYISPSLYGDDAFWHSTYIETGTGTLAYTFDCPKEVELVIAFTLPSFATGITYKKLDRLAFVKNRRDCTQPTISSDKKTVFWTLVNPTKNKSYVCFVFYKDGVQNFRQIVNRNWMEKLFLRMKW